MFINLSNHPFDEWDARQQADALSLFGEVKDMPFPQIAPQCSTEDIWQLAYDFLEKIEQIANSNKGIAVHLMGEMTFSFALVQLLQQKGIVCYASTSKRNVEWLESGEKIVKFKFVQFRKYV